MSDVLMSDLFWPKLLIRQIALLYWYQDLIFNLLCRGHTYELSHSTPYGVEVVMTFRSFKPKAS
jgi:hypothetical protein